MRIPAMSGVVALLLAAALAAGCGGGEPAETAGDAGEGGETAEETAETTGEEGAVEAEEVVLYPEGTLDPDQVAAETPVQARALKEAYFAWDSMEVTVAGYPYIFYGDSTTLEEEITLKASPESEEELVTVIFEEPPNVTVAGTDLVAARGTGVLSWTGDLEVTGAEPTEPPEELVAVETSPYVYDGVTPIPAAQLAELYTGWVGREVTVEGYYHSTTTSTTDYGTTIRVDLAHPEDTYTKYVGCEMADPIPEETESLMVANRDGVRIRGTVAGESFGNVALENCVIANP
jgi:hypothetical protein